MYESFLFMMRRTRALLLRIIPDVRLMYLEAHEGDLHGQDGAEAVHGAVSHVDAVGESSGEHQHQYVQGDQVDEENVASPR